MKITSEQCQLLQTKLKDWFNKINIMSDEDYKSDDDRILDLCGSGFSPYNVSEVLEEKFGYKRTDIETHGWDCEYCFSFKSEASTNRCSRLTVSGTALEFSLYIDTY